MEEPPLRAVRQSSLTPKIWQFSPEDLRQITELGLTEAEVRRQLELFTRRGHLVDLARPCLLGDGIREIPPGEAESYLNLHAQAAAAGRFVKFVPASGAASRMFQAPLVYLYESEAVCFTKLVTRADRGDPDVQDLVTFCRSLERFAFFADLKDCLAEDGHDAEELLGQARYREVLQYLLTERGLNYQALPKGLLKFHSYGAESRTALEEHLVEATGYVRDREGRCRLHFTISPEFQEQFSSLLKRVGPLLERRHNCSFQVEFSQQSRATDTIAVDLHNRPYRDDDGRLHFRPGGHGALIHNLDALQGDLVYIKNIDNVVPDRLREATVTWKKILGGFLVFLKGQLDRLVARLATGSDEGRIIAESREFMRYQFGLALPGDFDAWAAAKQGEFLLNLLNRPVRVCGVVKNQGEPGGAPFWVRQRNGDLSLQIVEGAQGNFEDPVQRAVWQSSTHFNPVDLVLAVRDWRGTPFKLPEFVDPEAVFISRKSLNGKELKALERPGLWNGAMARWLTVFVEVPAVTFNPVKTALDLLRPEHQAE